MLLQKKEQPRNDTPSAPPFVGLGPEMINPAFDQISSLSGVHEKPLYTNSDDSVTTNGIHSGTTVKDNIETLNPSYRFVHACLCFFLRLSAIIFSLYK